MPTSAELAQQLATYDANKKSSADILNESMAQYGIPEIRSRVANLRTTLGNTESALNAVDPSVTGRTSRSLVTEAQRQAIVNKERQPIAQQYGDQSKALTTESANLSDQQRAAETLAQGRINDYTIGRNALQSQYDMARAAEAEAQRRAEADRAYQLEKQNSDRQYQLSLSKGSSGGGGSSSSSATPHSQQRSDKGFNFQDASGKAISARTYAAQAGISFNSMLKQMAAAGDAGAKDVLKNGAKSKYYQALVWG